MWSKSYSVVTKEVTKEQLWKLFSNVNNWHSWDEGVEFAEMKSKFEKGNHFILKPKGGPKIKIELVEVIENKRFMDFTKFPLAVMYGDHTFEDTPDGLRITTTMSIKGMLAFVWIKLVAQNIVNGLPGDMKKQIETARTL